MTAAGPPKQQRGERGHHVIEKPISFCDAQADLVEPFAHSARPQARAGRRGRQSVGELGFGAVAAPTDTFDPHERGPGAYGTRPRSSFLCWFAAPALTRAFSQVMIFVFLSILYSRHWVVVLFVMLLQVMSFRELVGVRFK